MGKYQVTKVPSTGDILVGQAALDFMSKKNKAAKESKAANAVTVAQPMTPVPVDGNEHAAAGEIRQPVKAEGFQIRVAKECTSEDLYKLLDRLGAFVDRKMTRDIMLTLISESYRGKEGAHLPVISVIFKCLTLQT